MPPHNRITLLLLLLCTGINAQAQYPFERYPAPRYRHYKYWIQRTRPEDDHLTYDLLIPGFFGKEHLTLSYRMPDDTFGDTLVLLRGKKVIQKIPADLGQILHNLKKPVRVADINGDGLQDIKIMVNGTGCGLAAEYSRITYLFQQPDHRFVMVSYMDMMYDHRPERDLDGDGNFEIITMDLKAHHEHNYWTFDVFTYRNNKFSNLDKSFDYPIMVQYLNRENYKPAPFNRKIRSGYATPMPAEFLGYGLAK